MQYPKTSVRKVVETIHGHKIVDQYRWLENGGSKPVQKWTDEQNTLTNSVIKRSSVNKFARELKRHYHFPSIGMLYKAGPYYFNWERQPDQQQSVLYIRKGFKGKKRVLIDLNKLSKKKTADIAYWAQSYSGKYMVYGLDLEGEEKAQMRLMETETGKDIEIIASNASGSSISWLP
jgi:prolyl oligopeptidase